MTFAAQLQAANTHAARMFGGVTAATAGAWFPTAATEAPTARSGFSVAVSDVVKGAPKATRDPLTGTLTTPSGTITISFLASALTYVPVANETVLIAGATRAAGTLYRVTAVNTLAGIYELECREEAQTLT